MEKTIIWSTCMICSAIAQLCNKYQITDRDIEAELHGRRIQELTNLK